MGRFLQTKLDTYYILDNNSGEEKNIGKVEEFIKYVNFLLKYDGIKEVKTIWKALEGFEKYYGGAEVGEGLEIVIRAEN